MQSNRSTVVTLLMEVERCLGLMGQDMEKGFRTRMPGRSILFAHGVEVVRSEPPHYLPLTTQIATLLETLKGFIVVDPAFRHREGMEAVAEAVERHKGELVAVFYTHGHSDHLADEGLLKEAFDVPVWSHHQRQIF